MRFLRLLKSIVLMDLFRPQKTQGNEQPAGISWRGFQFEGQDSPTPRGDVRPMALELAVLLILFLAFVLVGAFVNY